MHFFKLASSLCVPVTVYLHKFSVLAYNDSIIVQQWRSQDFSLGYWNFRDQADWDFL